MVEYWQNRLGKTYNGVVTTDGARSGGKGVGGTEDGCGQMLDTKGTMGYLNGLYILRPVLTTSRPSQTMATMGPLSMSRQCVSRYLCYDGNGLGFEDIQETRPLKKGLSERSA